MLHKCDSMRDWALLILRLSIGAIFLYHGWMKWPLGDSMLFNILAIAEPLGGAAMILGVLTRWAGLGLAIIMLGAMYMKMTGFGQGAFDLFGTFAGSRGAGWEFDLMIFAGCIVTMAFGAGSLSVDKAVLKQS